MGGQAKAGRRAGKGPRQHRSLLYLGQLGLPISGSWSFLCRAIGGSLDGPAQENSFFHEYIVNISKHADI